jgi:hypothetical protein
MQEMGKGTPRDQAGSGREQGKGRSQSLNQKHTISQRAERPFARL